MEQSESITPIFFPLLAIAVMVGTSLLIIALVLTTNIFVQLGSNLGLNLPQDDALVVYDATCRGEFTPRLNITYWSQDTAPLTIRYHNLETPVFPSEAGINSLELLIRTDVCPDSLELLDISRGRAAGASVEIITNG